MDIYNTEELYEREVRKIAKWDTSENNKAKFLDFLEKMKNNSSIGIVQRLKYIQSMKTFIESCSKEFEEFSKEDLDNFLAYMSDKYKPKTKHIKWYCVKKFFDFIGKGQTFKEFKVKFNIRNNNLPDILTENEIEILVNGCNNVRDKAIVATLYESGCRIGEFLNLKMCDVQFDDYGAILLVNGKTGSRRIRIINSVPLLRNWLENHHPIKNPQSYVWVTKYNRYDGIEPLPKEEQTKKRKKRAIYVPMSHSGVVQLLKGLRAKTGITKNIWPHLFRHSRATHLANILTYSQLCEFFGWQQGSRIVQTYVHMSGKMIDDTLLKAYGIKKEEGSSDKALSQLNSIDISLPFGKESKFELLLLQFLKVLADENPKVKEKFVEVVKQNKMEDLFK